MTTLSVVMPCYNGAAYLAEALVSALQQAPAPDEILVVDDGSTDGSAGIAEGFIAGVRCVRQEHQGVAVARNHGLSLARGDFIAFLDADDLWPAGSLAARRAVLDTHPEVDIAAGLVRQFISPELPDEIRRTLTCPDETSRGRLVGSMLIRRHVFERIGDFNPSFQIGEAIDWVARADLAGLTSQTLDEVVLLRRIHTSNTTTRLRNEKGDYLRVLKASLDRRRAAERGEAVPESG